LRKEVHKKSSASWSFASDLSSLRKYLALTVVFGGKQVVSETKRYVLKEDSLSRVSCVVPLFQGNAVTSSPSSWIAIFDADDQKLLMELLQASDDPFTGWVQTDQEMQDIKTMHPLRYLLAF
jgi:hypothetical protein